ncbi:MRG-domain-containing protein [Mycena chlorophos]|uniref:Chromatin modification-related protein EAF3 n=1 Tax=Mycena chlorophos TaxID=658473 RepID=A0A8H6VWW9_MYCCL|nr:MRG-domain-containing protein [Mycena chlorophos]
MDGSRTSRFPNMEQYSTGESVLCYHGPLIYSAKILKTQEPTEGQPDAITGQPGVQYFVHYKGWKTTWDEWVPADRLLKDNEINKIKQKELKAQQSTKERSGQAKPHPALAGGPGGASASAMAGTSASANASTRSGTRKDVGTRGTKRGRDELEGNKKQPDMRLNIPEQLKAKLVDDWEAVTKNAMLVSVPREPTVEQVLDEFEAHIKATKPSRQASPTVQHFLLLKQLLYSLKDPEKLSGAVISGLKTYFDKALGNCLLYREERDQLVQMRKKFVTGQHVKEAREMSAVYGAEHLLRMLVTMPTMTAQSNLDLESTDIVREYVNELLQWMLQEQGRLFQREYQQQPASAAIVAKS